MFQTTNQYNIYVFFFLPLSYHIIFPLYPHSILLNLTGWVTDLLICCDLAAPHLLHQLDCQGPLARRSARLKSWRNSQLSSDENPWWVNSRWLYIYLSLSIYIYIIHIHNTTASGSIWLTGNSQLTYKNAVLATVPPSMPLRSQASLPLGPGAWRIAVR